MKGDGLRCSAGTGRWWRKGQHVEAQSRRHRSLPAKDAEIGVESCDETGER